MEIVLQDKNNYRYLRFSGRLDASTSQDADQQLRNQLDNCEKLLIDLEELTYIAWRRSSSATDHRQADEKPQRRPGAVQPDRHGARKSSTSADSRLFSSCARTRLPPEARALV